MGHSSPQVVRAFVASFEIKPLDPVREATGQDHRSIAVDGQPPDVRHQAVLPDDLRIQPARSPRGQHFDPDQHAERRSSHQERTVRQEAKVRHRLDGLQPPGRPAEAVEKAHGTQPAADRDIAAVRINRQERRLAGSGPLDAHLEIGIEQQQAGIIAFPEQRDQRSFITDRPCHDPLGNPGKRQRLPLCVQQVELVPLIPGEDPAGLARRTEPLSGASVTMVQAVTGSSRLAVRHARASKPPSVVLGSHVIAPSGRDSRNVSRLRISTMNRGHAVRKSYVNRSRPGGNQDVSASKPRRGSPAHRR